jgi:hypothetical protein
VVGEDDCILHSVDRARTAGREELKGKKKPKKQSGDMRQ